MKTFDRCDRRADAPTDAKPEFRIFTSIPPRANIEIQRKILNSWRLNGFTPITVNSANEADQLAANEYDIEIKIVPSSGKPRISEILSLVQETGALAAGIANADCRMIYYPRLAQTLQSVVSGKVIYARRLETIDGKPTFVESSYGFDAFFFDTAFIRNIKDSIFRIGECWWDYWLPLRLAVNGAKIAKIAQPILLHEQHPVKWSNADFQKYGDAFWQDLRTWSFEMPVPPVIASRLASPTTESALNAGDVYRWLRNQNNLVELSLLPREYQEVETLLSVDHLIADPEIISASITEPQTRLWTALLHSLLRFFSEPYLLKSRVSRGVDLLRRGGVMRLARHIVRFGSR